MPNPPQQFTDCAMDDILDYLRDHREEWENKTEEELDTFKEDMEMILFNTDIKFQTRHQCTDFIDEEADLIFYIVDYVAEKDEEFGGELDKSLISQFNRCWYYTGMELIRNEWNVLIDNLNETDSETDVEMEG